MQEERPQETRLSSKTKKVEGSNMRFKGFAILVVRKDIKCQLLEP